MSAATEEKTTDKTEHAKDQARAQLDSIVEMLKVLKEATEEGSVTWNGDTFSEDEMQQTLSENALSVEVRSGWYTPGEPLDVPPTEYKILLCTGGPAVQIYGELDEYGKPDSAVIQYQDWFTPWEPYRDTTDKEDELLLEYAQSFYFGE